MDWISFLWGVGAIIFVNIAYTILVVPKQLKKMAELENRVSKSESFLSEYEEKLASLNKERDKLTLALDELTLAIEKTESSIKLRKSCPTCGVEFPLYIFEEEK